MVKINVYQESGLKENHLDLHYNQMDDETMAIRQYLFFGCAESPLPHAGFLYLW